MDPRPPRVRIKICGITSVGDALAAVDAGADALGFIFHPPSPRCVPARLVREIVAALPPFVARVGVFVDADEERVRGVAREAGLDTLQFHGAETPEYCQRFAGDYRVIKAFRVEGPAALERARAFDGFAWLLDSYVAGAMGGTGRTFNWDLAREAVRRGARVILAGGLTPENAGEAVATVRPFGLDISSGVEQAPGRKDVARMQAFTAAAWSA